MKKKKILFVIPNLGPGGAEKSLVNLLNTIDSDEYSVDLFLFSQTGLFLNQIPEFVKILPLNNSLKIFQLPLIISVSKFITRKQISLAIKRILYAFTQRIFFNKAHAEQYSWKHISKSINKLPDYYNASISFLEKSSIYFTIDKVHAEKKIGWIHNDYNELRLDKEFDKFFINKLNYLITISEECADILKNNFPKEHNKIKVIYNISSSILINKMAEYEIEFDRAIPAIVSVGRLHSQKGFSLAVEAAKILRDSDIRFCWYIIGEGSQRKSLENLIRKYDLTNQFRLLGLKKNPYPYIKNANVYVQPSLYEGKSIAVDEAKILGKPIVLTNFNTAKDQIKHEHNGLICEKSPSSLANAIIRCLGDNQLVAEIVLNLKLENLRLEKEIEKLYFLLK